MSAYSPHCRPLPLLRDWRETGGLCTQPASQQHSAAKHLCLVATVAGLLVALIGLATGAASASPVMRFQTRVAATEHPASQFLGPVETTILGLAAPLPQRDTPASPPLVRRVPQIAVICDYSSVSFLPREHVVRNHKDAIRYCYDQPTTSARRPIHACDLSAHNALARAGVELEVTAIAPNHPTRGPPPKDCGLARRRPAAEGEELSLSGRLQTESSFGDKAIQNALKVPAEPGYFDVIGNGTPTDVSGLSPSELADQIESNPGWGGQNVRLLSCSTGCPSGTYAQDLANDLGVTVQAPTTDVWVSSRGVIHFDPGGDWAYFSPQG